MQKFSDFLFNIGWKIRFFLTKTRHCDLINDYSSKGLPTLEHAVDDPMRRYRYNDARYPSSWRNK